LLCHLYTIWSQLQKVVRVVNDRLDFILFLFSFILSFEFLFFFLFFILDLDESVTVIQVTKA